jgi:hypothetical protein
MEKPWKTSIRHLGVAIVAVGALIFGGNGTEAAPCAVDLDSCPLHGCAKPGTPDALVNQRKRTKPAPGIPVLLTLEDFDSLQEQADKLVGQNKALTQASRKKLRQLKLKSSDNQVSEGDLVQVVAYMVGLPNRPKASGPESVNCRLTGKDNNDFHIPIAPYPEDNEIHAIVVEMIPQERPRGWAEQKLRSVARQGLPVLVRGQLFYDNKHLVNSDPDDIKPRQPKRFSLWEIHPITEFYVCISEENKCDPTGYNAVGAPRKHRQLNGGQNGNS